MMRCLLLLLAVALVHANKEDDKKEGTFQPGRNELFNQDIKYHYQMDNDEDRYMRNSLDTYIRKLRNSSIGFPNPHVGKLVAEWNSKSGVHPEELGSTYLEGDILTVKSDCKRKLPKNYLWPQGKIYYKINGEFCKKQVRLIRRAMRHIEKKTKCISFVKADQTTKDYVSIESEETGCFSALGRIGGKQILNLQAPNCVRTLRTPVHELCHAIGLPHEHTRANRDKYVKVKWQNIQTGKEHNFKRRPNHKFKVPYSYYSIMHYTARAFSKNGRRTLRAKKPAPFFGWVFRLNDADVAKIRALYDCDEKYVLHSD